MKNINNISQNSKYIFEVDDLQFKKINYVISELRNKYYSFINGLYIEECKNSNQYDFYKLRILINKQKKLIISIINDVINCYKDELSNIECIFLSGSYARGTNKMASDLDLHIFYKNDNYNFLYEEIVSYIISRIINKSRDSIDPTFILNFSQNYKNDVTNVMTKNKLEISICSNKKQINYSYCSGKKRRFYLQYNNSRDINILKNYIIGEINKENLEWTHCFEILYGKQRFNKIYDSIYNQEKKKINYEYILIRINKLKQQINLLEFEKSERKISEIKKYFQSKIFEIIYEYISILRFKLINEGYNVKFINLYEIYDFLQLNNDDRKEIVILIYKYLWVLRKLTIYCHKNNINYGLHNHQYINYNLNDLILEWNTLKERIILELEKMECEIYEQSNTNITNDAC